MGEGSSDPKMSLVPRMFIMASVQRMRAGTTHQGTWFLGASHCYVKFLFLFIILFLLSEL